MAADRDQYRNLHVSAPAEDVHHMWKDPIHRCGPGQVIDEEDRSTTPGGHGREPLSRRPCENLPNLLVVQGRIELWTMYVDFPAVGQCQMQAGIAVPCPRADLDDGHAKSSRATGGHGQQTSHRASDECFLRSTPQ